MVESASFQAEIAKFRDRLSSVLERTHHDIRGGKGTVPGDEPECPRG